MALFGIRQAIRNIAEETMEVVGEAVNAVDPLPSFGLREEIREGWADALTSDKHWLKDEEYGGSQDGPGDSGVSSSE